MKKIFASKNFQIIYGLILIILVPTVIVLNTLALNRSFRTNIDIQLQRQALSLGRSFNLAVKNDLNNLEKLQQLVVDTVELQTDIKNIEILKYQGDDFLIIADSDKKNINHTKKNLENFIAWHQNQAIATLTFLDQTSQERFWLITMPIKDASNKKKYLLNMSVSLQVMDDLVKQSLTKSYIFLTLTVLILILLLAANTRMFEYAILFKKMKEVNTMKDEFISIASHELRTPLTVIKGYTSMLLNDKQSKFAQKSRQALQTISSSAERLAELVEDLLNVSRIEQNRITINKQMVNVVDIAKEVIGELQYQAREKGLSLEFSANERIPHILTDRKRLKQVLVNIVGNAVKYTLKGSVKLLVEQENEYIKLTTTDTGIGISEENRRKLFQKFYRVKNEKTRDVAGSGLGLWITKKIVEMLSGKITFDSIPNVGSQVSILLPIKNNKK